MEVLFEDNHLIAINKLPGDIVQGDKTGDIPLSEHVKKYLKEKYDKSGDVFLGVAHRLDRPVSGVITFAKTSKALERLNKLFHDKEVQKTYWAIVKNPPPKGQDVLVHFLIRNEMKNKSKAFDKEVEGSKRAELEYKVLKTSDKYFLLEIKPKTGRHHQIRAQLNAIGCPIKGDLKYGFARSNENASIHLHSRRAEFIHPVKNTPIVITANPPKDFLWNLFMNELNAH